jgi:glutamate-1-semialdehyde aminotransferase
MAGSCRSRRGRAFQRRLRRRHVRLLPAARAATELRTGLKTDGARFNQLFHGLLDRGVYIAPALYEAGFVSAAHTEQDIADTVAIARDVFKSLTK